MKIFTTACKDNITGMEMVATELSFNMACSYLEGINGLGNFLGCEASGDMTKIKFEKRSFLYNEKRGVLLGE